MSKENKNQQNLSSGESVDSTSNNKRNKKNKGWTTRKIILFAVLGIVVIGAGIYGWNWYQFSQDHVSTDNAQVDGHISPVIPRVNGYVNRIYVDDNEQVKKGQLLVSVQKDDYKLAVEKARAGVSAAIASKQETAARLATAKAQKNSAHVSLKQARTNKERQQRLFKDHSTTQQKLDDATYALESAQAQYDVAKRKLESAKTQQKSAQAQVEQAQSSLDDAKLQLSYTDLHAPISGRVSKKNIESGQYISPGNPVMAIAHDDSVWVVANFKEGEVSGIKVGQPVDIDVDAYTDTTFQGRVQSLAGATGSKFALLPPDNASGNFVKVEQRIPVKILIQGPMNRSKPLKPGMNVVPTIKIH